MVRSITRTIRTSVFRCTLFIAAAAAILASPARSSFAQGTTTDPSSELPIWRPGHAVTTSTADILPPVIDLVGFDHAVPMAIPPDWNIPPGYYRSTVCSYCMDFGRHAPDAGDSVFIAPILGDRAPVIRNILTRAPQNLSIMQRDIQNLIWCVTNGTQLGWNGSGFLERVGPLLSPSELAVINMPRSAQPDPEQIAAMQEMAVMNYDQVRSVAFMNIRRRGGVDPSLTAAFTQLRMAGVTTPDQFNAIELRLNERFMEAAQSETMPDGVWADIGDGFYLRAFVDDYAATILEVLKVAPGSVTQDDLKRITRFDSGGYVIEASYDDTPATRKVDGKPVPIWNFKSIVFREPGGQQLTLENKGFVVRDPDTSAQPAGRAASTPTRDPLSVGLFHSALVAVSKPAYLKIADQWIIGNLNRLLAARNLPNNSTVLSSSTGPKHLEVSKYAATSTNRKKQRLALSSVVRR